MTLVSVREQQEYFLVRRSRTQLRRLAHTTRAGQGWKDEHANVGAEPAVEVLDGA
jgi:hypothetical protein